MGRSMSRNRPSTNGPTPIRISNGLYALLSTLKIRCSPIPIIPILSLSTLIHPLLVQDLLLQLVIRAIQGTGVCSLVDVRMARPGARQRSDVIVGPLVAMAGLRVAVLVVVVVHCVCDIAVLWVLGDWGGGRCGG